MKNKAPKARSAPALHAILRSGAGEHKDIKKEADRLACRDSIEEDELDTEVDDTLEDQPNEESSH